MVRPTDARSTVRSLRSRHFNGARRSARRTHFAEVRMLRRCTVPLTVCTTCQGVISYFSLRAAFTACDAPLSLPASAVPCIMMRCPSHGHGARGSPAGSRGGLVPARPMSIGPPGPRPNIAGDVHGDSDTPQRGSRPRCCRSGRRPVAARRRATLSGAPGPLTHTTRPPAEARAGPSSGSLGTRLSSSKPESFLQSFFRLNTCTFYMNQPGPVASMCFLGGPISPELVTPSSASQHGGLGTPPRVVQLLALVPRSWLGLGTVTNHCPR